MQNRLHGGPARRFRVTSADPTFIVLVVRTGGVSDLHRYLCLEVKPVIHLTEVSYESNSNLSAKVHQSLSKEVLRLSETIQNKE